MRTAGRGRGRAKIPGEPSAARPRPDRNVARATFPERESPSAPECAGDVARATYSQPVRGRKVAWNAGQVRQRGGTNRQRADTVAVSVWVPSLIGVEAASAMRALAMAMTGRGR